MYSLDFEEFLWASGISSDSIENIKECFAEKKTVPAALYSYVFVKA